jgi:hypothetical protein
MLDHDLLYLLTPQQLPSSPLELYGRSVYFQTLQQSNSSKLSISTLTNVQADFLAYLNSFPVITDDKSESQSNKDNDVTFNIFRVKGDSMDVICSSAIKAFLYLIADIQAGGTSLNVKEIEILYSAYLMLFNFYLNPASPLVSDFTATIPEHLFTLSSICPDRAHRRWLHGHYVFMTLIQGMIINLNCFYAKILGEDFNASVNYLSNAALLMRGAENALKYAGNYSNESYVAGVRPTLMPPKAPPRLSGLYWRDHEYLIKHTLKKLYPVFTTPHPLINAAVDDFKNAMSYAYDAHKYVCQKFVGVEENSLLSNKPAVEVLENFKKARLSYLNGD